MNSWHLFEKPWGKIEAPASELRGNTDHMVILLIRVAPAHPVASQGNALAMAVQRMTGKSSPRPSNAGFRPFKPMVIMPGSRAT